MNKKYNLKLDLQFRCNNSTMKFDEFDNNTSDFFIRVTRAGELIDISKAIVTLVVIKPDNSVDAQFVDIDSNRAYCDLKPTMKNLVGKYEAIASITVDGETVNTGIDNPIIYEVTENKFLRQLNQKVVTEERFTLLTDMINRLSTIEISEEQRVINEAERILSEENRKIEEAKRVEAELIRQHEEADRSKYDATRESNENIRKQNESIRLANETNRIDEEAKRVQEENKRKLAEEERNANYNFMTEDEDRRRSEANAHKEAEKLRAQAENTRVNEEAKRRTTEQGRVSAENTRVSNENTRKTNEETRQNNEIKRVEAETKRQNRYNSFILEAEANANNFENYTNSAKIKEEERKSNELNRKSQEDRRVSNEVERISNENTRKANEAVREKNETSRQYVFENKVNEVDKKIVELNTTKDNFVSNINTKVDTKISELDSAKSDMTNTVANKVNEVENRFNALTSKQQQDAEVIDARDGETSLKARLDRDIEKAKQVYVNVEGSHISTDSSVGYLKDIEILGNTIQNASNLADIRSVGDKVEGQELYEIPVLSCGKNLFNSELEYGYINDSDGNNGGYTDKCIRAINHIKVKPNTMYSIKYAGESMDKIYFYDKFKKFISLQIVYGSGKIITTPSNCEYIRLRFYYNSGISMEKIVDVQLEEGTQATPYEPYVEDKLTILSPTPLEKVGDVADRLIEKDGVWGVEKNIETVMLNGSEVWGDGNRNGTITSMFRYHPNSPCDTNVIISDKFLNKTNNIWTADEETIYSYKPDNYIDIRVNKSKLVTDNTTGFKQWLQSNPTTVKYGLATPQFIPLPHDQQVKLRTFANKTNISFGCEIEGTIKAQVPKSIGATVNTHTEQISNLNKELDRVKKLEESTVSTVTTESDFTTVEATSNGYFEDVKLEGRTLVNLYKNKAKTYHADYVFSPNERVNLDLLIPGNTYTAIVHNSTTNFDTFRISSGDITYDLVPLSKNTIVKFIYTPPTNDEVKNNIRCYCYPNGNKFVSGDENKISITILEGDHTQNPPSYFEGLKSVGQSASEDGVDEIVVESVNENLWNNGRITVDTNNVVPSNATSYVYLGKGEYRLSCKYTDDSDSATSFRFNVKRNDRNGEVVLALGSMDRTISVDRNGLYYIAIDRTSSYNGKFTSADIMLNKGTISKPYTPHQSDKKRLLYYNEETQAWEKPILREWDSIEKHANGKYYYHQRSGEVVLNGSESWSSTGNDICYGYQFSSQYENPISKVDVVCDKLLGIRDTYGGNRVGLCVVSHNSKALIRVGVSQTSVEDFKQWLQANNVTVVYQLAEEKVYECTNIDLITYANETNYVVESGVLSPRTTLKVHSNISNVVSLLQKKVSLLESNVTSYMTTQNRLMLASRYNSDAVSFKVDYAVCSENMSQENYDTDLYNLILNNILVGKDNYDYDHMFNIIMDYASWSQISWDQFDILVGLMDIQHNPPIEEIPTDDEIVEEIPNEIM